MNDLLASAEAALLAPAELSRQDVERALVRLSAAGADLGEAFFQSRVAESWALEDGLVKQGSFDLDRGLGVRALSGEATGAAYTDDIQPQGFTSAVQVARSAVRSGTAGSVQARRPLGAAAAPPPVYGSDNPIPGLDAQAKVALLARLDRAARRADNRVREVNVQLSLSHDTVLVMATDGVCAADFRPMMRLDVSVIVTQGKRRERGYSGGGGRCGLSACDDGWAEGLAEEAVRTALVNLDAVDAPAGPTPVVLGPGWPGVLLHEAVGHGLEGDFNRKGSSAFANRIGEQVASPGCTVIDDGALPERRGSLTVDDEGTPTGPTVLIENGVLKGYLQDKLNARLMGVAPTGNGRRQSYAHAPMPRMTNTFMQPGRHCPDEIIAACRKGVYAVNFGGGQVDITSGRFVFSATEAYLIEGGKVTRPIRGATLIGSGPRVMTRVSMVGNDLALDQGVGVCGKEGQTVPVGVGQPTLLVDEIIIGGTSA